MNDFLFLWLGILQGKKRRSLLEKCKDYIEKGAGRLGSGNVEFMCAVCCVLTKVQVYAWIATHCSPAALCNMFATILNFCWSIDIFWSACTSAGQHQPHVVQTYIIKCCIPVSNMAHLEAPGSIIFSQGRLFACGYCLALIMHYVKHIPPVSNCIMLTDLLLLMLVAYWDRTLIYFAWNAAPIFFEAPHALWLLRSPWSWFPSILACSKMIPRLLEHESRKQWYVARGGEPLHPAIYRAYFSHAYLYICIAV